MNYRIERKPHGWLVFGSVPIGEFSRILKSMPKGSLLNIGISNHFSATACVAESQESSDAWEKEIEQQISVLPAEEKWLSGVHTGLSSLNIFRVLTRDDGLKARASNRNGRELEVYTPRDADDFSRCYRLLSEVPEWSDRMSEVAEAYPNSHWPQIVKEWKQLVWLHETGDHKELTVRLRSLNGETP